jgi:DNA-binding SARP family transcriptional activator/tetratricopeptide (TPR) repeat protein
MIVLRALGTAEIDTGVTTLTPSQEIVFAAALYLILERGKRVSRARLAGLLWPRVPEKARAHRLRQTILQLKKLGIMVRADRDNLQLSQFDAQSDLEDLAAPDLAAVLRRDSLEFLPGYNPRLSEPLRDWVDSQRDQTHAVATGRLVEALNSARQKGDWATCERLALHCRKLDPLNETAVLAHAEVTAISGRKKEALAILDRYLEEVGSANNKHLTVSATILRKRITERVPERSVQISQECGFVGRSLEIEKLNQKLCEARRGKGGGCLVIGEAGIGKSRLGFEIAKLAELDGVIAERAVCRRPDLDRPLSVFVDLVPRLRELRGALGCSPETVGLLKRLTEFDTTGADATSISDSSAVYARMRRALFDLFDAIADEQCVLVVLDDIQWLDAASATLLAAMIPWASSKKLFFLLNQRVGPSTLSTQISAIDLPVLVLSALADSSAKTLLATIIRDQSDKSNEDLISRLITFGEGNPFFLQELGKHWIESGERQEFPPSIAAVIDDRLSHLSGEALQVLQACAVLGVNATIERVERMLEYKSHRLLSAVQELSISGMLQAEGEASADTPERVCIRHDLIATAALKRVATTPLAFLHRRAGAVLQQDTLGGGTSTALLWACALHWRHAGDRERSFSAARACAEHLLEVGLPLDSARAFERALEHCVTDEQRLLILSRLAVARQMHGDWEKSKEVLQRFRQMRATTAPNENRHDEAEFALFDATWRASLENSALLNDLLECTNSREASAGHRVACGLLALKVASHLNEIRVIEEVYQTLAPLADSLHDSSRVRAEIDMIFHSICGDIGKLSAIAKAFLDAVRGETNPLTFSRAMGNAATAYRLAGEKEEAETLFRKGLDHALAHGLSSRATFACYSLVRLYLAAGDTARAREALDRSEQLTDLGEDIHLIRDRNYLRARVTLEEGNIEAASSHCAVTQAETNPNQSINRRTSVLALGIMVGISKGLSVDGLRPLVRDLESMHMLNRASGWQDFEALALFSGLRACGEGEKGHRLLAEYATIHRRERGPLPRRINEMLYPPNNKSNEGCLQESNQFQRDTG